MKIKAEDFGDLLVAILGAMPPDSKFCTILMNLAKADAFTDFMDANYASQSDTAGDSWEQDKGALVDDLKKAFGDELDLAKVKEEWEKQAFS